MPCGNRRIEPRLICRYCKRLLSDAHRLPCDHVFCLEPCLQEFTVDNRVFCPICRCDYHRKELEQDLELIALANAERNRKIIVAEAEPPLPRAHFPLRIPSPPLPAEWGSCSACERRVLVQDLDWLGDARICTQCHQDYLDKVRRITWRLILTKQKKPMLNGILSELRSAAAQQSPLLPDIDRLIEAIVGLLTSKFQQALNQIENRSRANVEYLEHLAREEKRYEEKIHGLAAAAIDIEENGGFSLDELLKIRRTLQSFLTSDRVYPATPKLVYNGKYALNQRGLNIIRKALSSPYLIQHNDWTSE